VSRFYRQRQLGQRSRRLPPWPNRSVALAIL
jgi:hypothetical protein